MFHDESRSDRCKTIGRAGYKQSAVGEGQKQEEPLSSEFGSVVVVVVVGVSRKKEENQRYTHTQTEHTKREELPSSEAARERATNQQMTFKQRWKKRKE